MPLMLTARCRDASLRRLMLRVGQEARVGRSDTVEMSLSGDRNLAEEHFVVCCDHPVRVEVIDPQQSLFVDGSPQHRLELTDRDEEIIEFVAGSTTFTVRRSPELSPTESPVVSTQQEGDIEETITDQSAAIDDVLEKMSLSDEAIALQVSPDRSVLFVQRLIDAGLANDALLFLACILSPADAVGWAMDATCLDEDRAGDLAVRIMRWTGTQSEADRINVRDQIPTEMTNKSLRWIAEAVVLSGGSLAPDDQPVISPPSHLTAIGVVTALRWALTNQPDQDAARAAWVESGHVLLKQIESQSKESADASRSESL